MEPKKTTHSEIKEPRISVQALAEYMAASERGKRTIAQSCRFRAKMRLIQYNEGKLAVAQFVRKGDGNIETLKNKADQIANKLAEEDYEVSVNEHNADLVRSFADVATDIDLPDAEIGKGADFEAIEINGVMVTMRANLTFSRLTRTNKQKVGAMMFRYGKGKSTSDAIGTNQAAAIFGFLRASELDAGEEPERALCRVVDLRTGATFVAPGDSVNIWNDMKAACASIAERWANIPKPTGAVL